MYGYEIFHENIMNTLIENARRGLNANTYIFEGAKGLGKHEAARLFANALVCDDAELAPCGVCKSCVETRAGTHPDIVVVKKENDRATLGVKPIRAMITECLIKPFYLRHKVFIIDEGDLLTAEAQNAFLKIIEEPPEYAVFIIVCSDAELLLQTVRSRAVRIAFPPVSDKVVRGYIERHYPEEPRIDFLVKYCAGIPKAADNIIENEDFERLREDALSLVPKLLSKNKLHAFDAAEYFDKNKENASELCDMLLLYLRDALVTASGMPSKTVNTDKSDKINILAERYPPRLLCRAIDELITAKKMINRYVKVSAAVLRAGLLTK